MAGPACRDDGYGTGPRRRASELRRPGGRWILPAAGTPVDPRWVKRGGNPRLPLLLRIELLESNLLPLAANTVVALLRREGPRTGLCPGFYITHARLCCL